MENSICPIRVKYVIENYKVMSNVLKAKGLL